MSRMSLRSFGIADSLVGPLLQQPQQLGLGLEGQVADFIQEQGAAVGRRRSLRRRDRPR